jgi:glycerol-3-phosphate acyltransferase PlsY
MKTMVIKSLIVLGGYLSGSIPFGLIYSTLFEESDLREHGSGNIGATNVLRNFGWTPGILVLLLDVSKGAGPVLIASSIFPERPVIAVLAGVSAIIGHIYPIFLGFDGGKGVATSAGVFAVLIPIPFVSAIAVFALGVGLTRYMSVGSLAGAVALPLAGTYWYGIFHPAVSAAGALALMVFWQHRENIQRLINGNEETFF